MFSLKFSMMRYILTDLYRWTMFTEHKYLIFPSISFSRILISLSELNGGVFILFDIYFRMPKTNKSSAINIFCQSFKVSLLLFFAERNLADKFGEISRNAVVICNCVEKTKLQRSFLWKTWTLKSDFLSNDDNLLLRNHFTYKLI